jgi:hypothetical protein
MPSLLQRREPPNITFPLGKPERLPKITLPLGGSEPKRRGGRSCLSSKLKTQSPAPSPATRSSRLTLPESFGFNTKIYSLPSPENLNPDPSFAHQTLVELLGEGLGVRESRTASRRLRLPLLGGLLTRLIQNLCPSPPAPHPREFGQRLISKRRVELRIHRERGAKFSLFRLCLDLNARGENVSQFIAIRTRSC